MAELSVSRRDGVVVLTGELTFQTVPGLLSQEQALVAAGGDALKIDLAGVVRGDSAGLALLVAWLRAARKQRRQIQFLNVPPQLREMARVSGLERLLPLS